MDGFMEEEFAIETQGLRKSYGDVEALKGVDLKVRKGEIFGFLGPNGAGKTTTIRCLLDMIRPNGGIAYIFGINPQENPVVVRARVGYLPGELHFDENMSVRASLRFLNSLRKGKADWEYVQQLASRLGLDLKIAIKNLSKGNKQKVGVIQALMHRPELLLLDEPTAGLDPLIQQEVLRLIREAREAGSTVFFSSHILSEVQHIAERVAIIRQGKVVEISETAALIDRSIHRIQIRFKEPISAAEIEQLPGVNVLSSENGLNLSIQVEGEMDALIKTLAAFPVSSLETERPTLEEIFLAYYKE
jgi:ABC-2 type transport system ATP-binding protein